MLNFILKQYRIIMLCWIIYKKLSADVKSTDLKFPKNFKIGVGSAAYQVEGAWNVSGRGKGIWDSWAHDNPARIVDRSNGDIACDSYYKYKEDVKLIKSLGMNLYRLSISWSRILPTGLTNVINREGIQYYKNLTAELRANGIEPIVTMHHFDHPQMIEDMGGWLNEMIVDWFVGYARILFQELGDNVKIWGTVNEPEILCVHGYTGSAGLAPGKSIFGSEWLCGHNVLKAHAKVYRMYDKEFRKTQQGEIGLHSMCTAYIPEDPNDTVTAETAFQFTCGWMNHAIQIGDYPEIMKKRIAMVSAAQGYRKSRLPEFSEEWISIIKGAADYIGVNHYTSVIVTPDPGEKLGIYTYDMGMIISRSSNWPSTRLWWLFSYPPGFGYVLRKIRDEYNNQPVRILEQGYPDAGQLNDYDRMNYLHDYMKEMLIAINRDHCNVQSYSIWGLMDDFELANGYSLKFGLFGVDFNDPLRPRIPKLSASWIRNVVAARELIQPIQTTKKEY